MRIILEGIETKEQVELFEKSIFMKYQGFYFSKPIPFTNLCSLLIEYSFK